MADEEYEIVELLDDGQVSYHRKPEDAYEWMWQVRARDTDAWVGQWFAIKLQFHQSME